MAAVCPVTACLASLTRPVAPLPSVRPSCHGPTCVFLFPLVDRRDVADMIEFRAESSCRSVATERRSFSLFLCGVGVIGKDIRSGLFSWSDSSILRRGVSTFGDLDWLIRLDTSLKG